MDKQEVINDIVNMIKIGVITIDDLEGFSEELIREAKRLTTLTFPSFKAVKTLPFTLNLAVSLEVMV